MKYTLCLSIFFIFIVGIGNVFSQKIPEYKTIDIDHLVDYLKPEQRKVLEKDGKISAAKLAEYFRAVFAERFYYDYTSLESRLDSYNELYDNQKNHSSRALDHLNKYNATTQWVLPFNYQNGGPVNAYALRHLARQHKMVDIAFCYFTEDRDPTYIQYFEKQMRSLNVALEKGKYEKIEDGNGVYEVYRSGYRIFNWLWIHNMFLNEKEYSDQDQLYTIATFLQHGQHLYERNGTFQSGNHQTKGMSSLAVLSILFQDFVDTEKWLDRAMLRLEEHLAHEINPDGFQFERTVHYHMADINNFFFTYQLAKINNIEVSESWENKLRSLFTTLAKIAYPDKSAPVLQDDTDIPWAEKNDISGAMTLGYLLFNDPEFGFFASDKVEDKMYWYLSKSQVDQLKNIKRKKPSYGSLSFEDTHYYVMREGWDPGDKVMIISAGVDDKKPDHQHGDILGIQAIANGNAILPNYQVRYSLEDYYLFKNSMVKNVALADKELQGKEWTSNKGGSGFGKFKKLPEPAVIVWETNPAFDLFIGEHSGFENISVDYFRQVIYVKDAFWIVKDNFLADDMHDYKQVWQGHYSSENGPNLLRSTFSDASGCDILQLKPVDTIFSSGSRGKNWTTVSKTQADKFNFLTIILPYKGYNNRIDETAKNLSVAGWAVDDSAWEITGNHPTSISQKNDNYFFDVKELRHHNLWIELSDISDLYVKVEGRNLNIHLLSGKETSITTHQEDMVGGVHQKKSLTPGCQLVVELK